MTFDSRTLRNALGCFATGVAVVTTIDADGLPTGVTVSSFTSVSLEPPLILFCLDNQNTSLKAFRSSGHFAVNVLRAEQRELSIRFANRCEDKWIGMDFERGTSGVPILKDCLAVLECRTVDIRDGGDHQICIGRVERVAYSKFGRPLLHYRGNYALLADGTA
jgi:flavin reductase (DIM6/NTAB) family NADH-FMN oxidoreductase RutF